MPTGQTAVILPVPEAEPLVRTWRARFDKHAAQGVPAPITLISPYLPLPAARAALPRALGLLARGPLRFTLRGLVRWPNLAVLVPDPDDGLRRLVRALAAPHALLPYLGRYGEAVRPHLTVAYGADLPALTRARFDAIAADVEPRLPLSCTGRELLLLVRQDGRWAVDLSLPLPPPGNHRQLCDTMGKSLPDPESPRAR
ncbi:2'-5' RNA ligase family protein [Myxococcota bacterium]|nr:2'-5' RNA ligase family protein [Myxococcota bacterium]